MDSISNGKKIRRKAREHNEQQFSCHKCFKTCEDLSRKLRVCSKCKFAKYCSRECQVAHWPMYKEECKEFVAYEEEFAKLTPDEAKIWNLLKHQWKYKEMMFMNDLVVTTLKKQDREQQPPTKDVCIELEFNYNAKTFLLAEEPKALPISCLDEEIILEMYYDNEPQILELQFAFVTCKDLGGKCSFYHNSSAFQDNEFTNVALM